MNKLIAELIDDCNLFLSWNSSRRIRDLTNDTKRSLLNERASRSTHKKTSATVSLSRLV